MMFKNLAKRYELNAICRSDMTEPVHEGIPVVVLDTIGELGRLYSLGDIIFVGGSLVKTGAIIFSNQQHMVNQFL